MALFVHIISCTHICSSDCCLGGLFHVFSAHTCVPMVQVWDFDLACCGGMAGRGSCDEVSPADVT